jgi:membrane protease YdiL (CAAX protease family)
MKKRPLIAYLTIVTLLSGGFIVGMKWMGISGSYLAGPYMLGPAIAAIITRLFFYEKKFRDAHLNFGKLRDYFKFWGLTLGIVVLCYLMYTAFGSISWDFSGNIFLAQLKDQMALSGQDINDLPAGLTPRMMLFIFVVGGLTFFNIPLIVVGFGEEFGWRGLLFPLLYRIKPWVGFVIGGLIWAAWHIPLILIIPNKVGSAPWQQMCNLAILVAGSICTFVFFAYVYVKSETIWVASLTHAVFNNASRSFSYFTKVEDQLLANLALTLTMIVVAAFIYFRKKFRVFTEFFSKENESIFL